MAINEKIAMIKKQLTEAKEWREERDGETGLEALGNFKPGSCGDGYMCRKGRQT